MRACHLDVASGPFKCHFGVLMYFEEILLDLKEIKEGKELMKHVVAGWKVNGMQEFPGQESAFYRPCPF